MEVLDRVNRTVRLSQENLPLGGHFFVAGSVWEVKSNSQEILQAMRETFDQVDSGRGQPDLYVRFHVDFAVEDALLWAEPHFRALDHLYYATYGPSDSMLVDQLGRRVIGSFSPAVASDLSYWKQTLLPILLGIASASIGVTPVHCACVVKSGSGLLLAGESGAGKSTSALSLSLSGFSYLSDDCTYLSRTSLPRTSLSRTGAGMQAWGLPTPVKLLPDAVSHFPELVSRKPVRSLNGELAFTVDPTEMFNVRRCLSCEPRWLVFLERKEDSRPVIKPVSSLEAASRLAADLEIMPVSIVDQYEYQLETIRLLVDRECWVVQHGLQPELLASLLAEFVGRDL
jgi:hypothetical protein